MQSLLVGRVAQIAERGEVIGVHVRVQREDQAQLERLDELKIL